MQVNDLLRQSKADAGFSAPPHIEAVEDMRDVRLGDADSVILYPNRHVPLVKAAGQADLAAGIPHAVGQDICDRSAQSGVIAAYHDGRFGEIRHNGNAAASGCRLHGANAVV